ncbi:hypothetical protein LMG31886_17690 [Xanthomonas hydrangeae]|nr:hypothetical protein LMG31886_17690 [Xanthomonas hydrangeae]CAD7732670.1 hypothetical protein LMG31886_17690 [Xanthomonas hydrangeae]CAD7746830.1 hypothetical protein LMG31885_42530 [Xanthomonas hydrangeae]CAD7746832.1 hypothetical protein LMG31885_42530 [Xanthomonas hydrangeae]
MQATGFLVRGWSELKPLSPGGEKAPLARHWCACLGAPAPQARAGARSGDWGEGPSSEAVGESLLTARGDAFVIAGIGSSPEAHPHPALRATFSRWEKEPLRHRIEDAPPYRVDASIAALTYTSGAFQLIATSLLA